MKPKGFALISLAVCCFFISPKVILADTSAPALSCDSSIENDTPDQLQQRLKKCEEDILAQGTLLAGKQREATTLERDISILNYRIDKSKLEIKARDISIKSLLNDIAGKDKTILSLTDRIGEIHSTTGELLRNTYELDGHSAVEFLFTSTNVSDFFSDVDN